MGSDRGKKCLGGRITCLILEMLGFKIPLAVYEAIYEPTIQGVGWG